MEENLVQDQIKSNILKIGINLDLEPEQRYKALIVNFDIIELKKEFKKLYESYIPKFPFLDSLVSVITFLGQCKIMYYDEIYYWSTLFDIPFHQILLMQLLYEVNSGCTTMIKTIEGKQTMIRIFDWPEPLLSKIIYQADYYKNGKKIYEGISILGCVGIFTGKNNYYSLAINYRRLNDITMSSIFKNFLNTVKSYWPVSYLVRYCLENEFNYEVVKEILKNSLLISPVYYTLNGYENKPVIIQRDTDKCKVYEDEIVVQTNCDQEDINSKDIQNIEFSIERNYIAKEILERNESFNNIIRLLKKFPIIREDTIYMSIITDKEFKTVIF